jgi:hypothetical protein
MQHAGLVGVRGRIAVAVVIAALAGCGGDEETDAAASPTNQSPQISGTPSKQIAADQPYSFVPAAQDPEGDSLRFEVANSPSWLTFNPSTGGLQGTPTAANVGVYRGITIQVTDGRSFSTLAPFDVEVVAVGSRSVTLSWLPPTENEDGSPLTNLAGYRIRYGSSSGSYSNTISVANPGLATYVVEGLVPSRYYFVIASVNSLGVESRNSAEAIFNL